MKPVLIYLRPMDATGQRIDIRVADSGSAEEYGTGGVAWQPAMVQRPRLSIELMSPDMDGKVQAGQASFQIAIGMLMSVPQAMRLYWKGAAVVIHNTGVLEGPTAVPDFWGYVTSASLDIQTGHLTVNAQVSTALIDKPLLTKEFGGGGGLDGEAAKRGTLLPAGFGAVKNIQPVWFDTTRNIGMLDGYQNTLSIDWLGEGLSSFGPRVADYASYDALAAAIDAKTVKQGQWATCVAQGLVGLGAPPEGIITAHAVFGSNRIGAMMKRILLTHAAVPAARVDTGAFDALDILVPKPVHYWTASSRNVKDLLEALAQSCNATPLVSFQNMVTVTRAIGGQMVGTLNRSGSVDPRVIDWQMIEVESPYYLIKARAARPATVLTDDQVNYVDTLVDMGVWKNAVVYRAGNLVWLADGSQWLYQAAEPSSGHAPPSSAAPDGNGNVQDQWWFRRQPPKTAQNFTYIDGTPLEALKPRQAGADVTSGNTAAGFQGQGILATLNGLGYNSPYLTGFGALAPQSAIWFGSSFMLEGVGGAVATLAAFKTLLGTAAAFLGQGALATQNLVQISQMLSKGTSYCPDPMFADQSFWAPDPASWYYENNNDINRGYTGKSVVLWSGSPGNNIGSNRRHIWSQYIDCPVPQSTKLMISAYFWNTSNQRVHGAVQFYDINVTYLGAIDTFCEPGQSGTRLATGDVPAGTKSMRFVCYNESGTVYNGAAAVTQIRLTDAAQYADGLSVDLLRPGEAGANVTEGRTAAAFLGQGVLATRSRITLQAGEGGLASEGNGQWLLNFDVVTISGVASGFAGQGSLATKNNVTLNDLIATGNTTSRVNGTGEGWLLNSAGFYMFSSNNIAVIELSR